MTTMRTLEWKVSGMDCSGCKLNIERVISKMNGVARGEVNYMAAKLEVEFNEEMLQAKQIEDAVEKLGFGIEPIGSANAESETTEKELSTSSLTQFFENSLFEFFSIKTQDSLSLLRLFFNWLSLGILDGKLKSSRLAPTHSGSWFSCSQKAFYGIKSGLYFSIESLMSLAV